MTESEARKLKVGQRVVFGSGETAVVDGFPCSQSVWLVNEATGKREVFNNSRMPYVYKIDEEATTAETLTETPEERVDALTADQHRDILIRLVKSIELDGEPDVKILRQWSLVSTP